MSKPRQCEVCRRDFVSHPRAGDRQRVCDDEKCQRERHRRACASWRERNPDYDRDRRATAQLEMFPAPAGPALQQAPLAQIPWEAVRKLLGAVPAQVLETALGQLYRWARDAVTEETGRLRRQVAALQGELRALAARDAFGGAPSGP
jgi:hypothetical protein